jgi:hypothetical protein
MQQFSEQLKYTSIMSRLDPERTVGELVMQFEE